MPDLSNSNSPVRGWTIKQIAKYVGSDTPISLVWNWQKRSEELDKGDPRRFPEPIGTDEKSQKVFNPIEVVDWLKHNNKTGRAQSIHPLLWSLAQDNRGGVMSNQHIELILNAFVKDTKITFAMKENTRREILIPVKDSQLAIEVKEFERSLSDITNKERRRLLDELQRFFLADKLNAEFSTPPRLATLAARLLDAQPGTTVYDPCAGTGRLLATVADESSQPGSFRLVGQELNDLTSRLGNARISVSEAGRGSGVHRGDSLKFDPQYIGFADYVIAHIPLRTKVGHEELLGSAPDPRFVYTKPTTSGDVAWIQVLLGALTPKGGRAVVIGSLFTTSHRQSDKLREALLRHRHVEAVISLAKNRREYGHGLPPTLIVFDTDSERSFRRKQVLFAEVAASTDEQQSSTADAFLIKLVKAFRSGNLDTAIQHPSITWRAVHHQEIASNNFLLSPSRYVSQPTRTNKPEELEDRIRSARTKLAATRQQLQDFQTRRKDSK